MIYTLLSKEREEGGRQGKLASLLFASIKKEFFIKNPSIWIMNDHKWRCLFPDKETSNLRPIIDILTKQTPPYLQEKDYIGYRYSEYLFVCQRTQKTPINELKSNIEQKDIWLSLLGDYLLKEKKETLFTFFKEAAHFITTSLREENFLDVIIQAAIDSLHSADTGFLFLYDEKVEKLLVKSAVGFHRDSYLKTRLAIGEGISGRVFQTGKPEMFYGKEKVAEAMKNMSEENARHYINSTIYAHYPNAVVSTPLICDGKKIGVLTLDGFHESAQFYQEDLEMLMTLADYIAVGIDHNILYRSEFEARKELELTHIALRKEHEQLQKTTDLYNELTTIATKKYGLDQMLLSIYDKSQAPVVLYDTLLKKISSAGTVDHIHKLPNDFLKKKEIKYSVKNKKWQTITLNEELLLLVIPVVGAESVIGFLCAWIDTGKSSESNRLLLELGSTVIALELTKEMSIQETKRRLYGELIDQLLTDKMDKQTLEQAKNLGFKENDYYAVLLCEERKQSLRDLTGNEQEIRVRWIERILRDLNIEGTVMLHNDAVLALMSFSNDIKKQEARNKMKMLAEKIKEIDRDVLIGIGRVYNSFFELNKSYRDVQQCMKLLRRRGKANILRYDDSGIYGFLLDHEEPELEHYIDDFLGLLLKYEEQKKGDLLKTLLYYVEYDRDLSALVSELSIHQNTLYYRIKRIEEILQVSFQTTENWFNIQLACKIYQFLYPEHEVIRSYLEH